VGFTGALVAGLAARIPHKIAMELMLLGDVIDAQRAYQVGLVNKVVPRDQLLEAAMTYARRLAANAPMVLALLREFVGRSREVKLIPPDLQISNPDYALDPAGAIHSMKSLTKGRTILIGDAAGFVSGSTGEGIYPGMVSGAIAADVVHEALAGGASDVSVFNQRWRGELGVFLRSLPGGDQKQSTVSRIDLIFKSRIVSAIAGRIFLYGEPLSVGTFLKSL
jgi:hypothetical protein